MGARGGGQDVELRAEPLDLATDPPARTARSPKLTRRTGALLSAAAVAIAALAGAAWLGPRSPDPTHSDAVATLTGTDWVLAGVDDGRSASGGHFGRVQLRVAHGRLEGDDGCNRFSAAATVRGHRLVLGRTISTAIGCRNELPVQKYFTGTVSWDIHGDRLTIAKDGIGTLVYRASRPAGPADLISRTWVLEGVENAGASGPAAAPASGTAVAFRPLTGSTLSMDASGGLTATTRCSLLTASVEVAAKTLVVGARTVRPHSCPPPSQDQSATEVRLMTTLRRVLAGKVPWSIRGAVLEIGRASGPVLQYRATSPQPAPS